MDGIALFREMVPSVRWLLEGTVQDVTPQQASWNPGGTALPIGAQYAHVILSQDMAIHGLLKGTAPLATSSWAGETGMSELPPPFGQSWDRWAKTANFDMSALQQYAQAVYQESDEYFASLTDAEWSRPIDLSGPGFGQQTVGFVLINGWLNNVNLHCGEIACLKGVQGAKGYPV